MSISFWNCCIHNIFHALTDIKSKNMKLKNENTAPTILCTNTKWYGTCGLISTVCISHLPLSYEVMCLSWHLYWLFGNVASYVCIFHFFKNACHNAGLPDLKACHQSRCAQEYKSHCAQECRCLLLKTATAYQSRWLYHSLALQRFSNHKFPFLVYMISIQEGFLKSFMSMHSVHIYSTVSVAYCL